MLFLFIINTPITFIPKINSDYLLFLNAEHTIFSAKKNPI